MLSYTVNAKFLATLVLYSDLAWKYVDSDSSPVDLDSDSDPKDSDSDSEPEDSDSDLGLGGLDYITVKKWINSGFNLTPEFTPNYVN